MDDLIAIQVCYLHIRVCGCISFSQAT
jgi:hypothetical protein